MTTCVHPLRRQDPHHRHDRRCSVRRQQLGRHLRLLHRLRRHHHLRHHAEKDEDVRRRPCSVRYGAARLPLAHIGQRPARYWERGWSFIKSAGTIILLSTIILWFLQVFGFVNGAFRWSRIRTTPSWLSLASAISWIFIPLGFGNWRATVASITGLIAKENVVGTFGVLYHYADELSDNGDEIWPEVAASFTAISAYSFLIFNLLCAPCFAAIGAIKREMNNGKWTAIAIGYMCLFAYCASLVVYQIGGLITGEVGFNFFTIVAIAIIAFTIYLLFRPNKYAGVNEVQFDSKKAVASK